MSSPWEELTTDTCTAESWWDGRYPDPYWSAGADPTPEELLAELARLEATLKGAP